MIRLFLIIFSISFGITALLLTIRVEKNSESPNTPLANKIATTPPVTPTPDPFAPKNILLLGYGGAGHDGGALTDTIILAHVRPKEQSMYLISIPRDLNVNLPVENGASRQYKINHAYAIGLDNRNYPSKPQQYTQTDGGRKLAADTVTAVTGFEVHHVVAISFSGFLQALALLEPIPVTVPQSFTDPFYPIPGKEEDLCGKSEADVRALTATISGFELEQQFICRYETLMFTKGVQQLTAEEALKFVRSRHSPIGGGDFNRSKRQAALLAGIKQKLFSPEIVPKLLPLANTIIRSVDTDVRVADLPGLLSLYTAVQTYSIETISLSTENILSEGINSSGQYILSVKPEITIQEFINQSIASISATQ